jgi:hypothetical protein
MGTLALTAKAEQMILELMEYGSLLLPDDEDHQNGCDRLIWFREGGIVTVDIKPPPRDPEATLDWPARRDVA